MARLRLRHPTGVSQIEIDIATSTVNDLQQRIKTETSILPSRQVLRTGYPPRALELVPDLPISSLGLQNGDQLIVSSSQSAAPSSGLPKAIPSSQTTSQPVIAVPSVPASAPQRPESSKPEYVETTSGALVHQVVPDDNSCLFSSLALILHQDIAKASEIRKAAADTIRSDPDTFSDAILGQPRDDYLKTIMKTNTWGGAIELSALATRYKVEIASVDVETGRVDMFSPPSGASNRCLVLYSGIHYDAVTLAPTIHAPAEWHQSLFSLDNTIEVTSIMQAASKLAEKLREKRAFTNTATFTLRCEVCKTGLQGEKEARAHAAQTGHTSFGEY